MKVTGYDTNPYTTTLLKSFINEYEMPIELKEEDFSQADLGKDKFDTVLLGQSLVHAPSKKAAHAVINKAVDAVKPGGHLWFRAGGNHGSGYQEIRYLAQFYPEIRQLDNDTFDAPCSCSGEYKIEPHLFLDPIETLTLFARNNMHIVHTQIITQEGKENIMYGENWNPGMPAPDLGGMITILAQKPS